MSAAPTHASVHQLYAPKGIGALYIRDGLALPPFMLGAGQEGGRRAGTEPVPLIVALGAACHAAKAGLHSYANHTAEVTARLRERLVAALPAGATLVHGPANDAHRLPNTLRCAFCLEGCPLFLCLCPFFLPHPCL